MGGLLSRRGGKVAIMKTPDLNSNPKPIDPEFLLKAYSMGIFPMAVDGGEIAWFSPDPRGIIPIDERFHIPHGLKRVMRKEPYEIRFNTVFEAVIDGCADRAETWIDDVVKSSYIELFNQGFAHSVEAWKDDELVGGLYGVSLGAVFFGESMFSRASDASKITLVHLVERMREREFTLLDTQWTNRHLLQFGAIDIPRSEYMVLLEDGIRRHAVLD